MEEKNRIETENNMAEENKPTMPNEKKEFDWALLWERAKKYLLNGYCLTCIVFFFILFFAGDQSIINQIRRRHELRELQEQRDKYRQDIRTAEQSIEILQSKDSLERYAREHYYMHAANEDIYLVE